MSSFGACDHCEQTAVVVVNGHRGCPDHVGLAMDAAFDAVQAALHEGQPTTD